MKPILLFLMLGIVLTACKKDKKASVDLPQISINISSQSTGVEFNGQLQNLQIEKVKEVGFVWGKNNSVSLSDGVSFKYGTKPTTDFTYTATSGFNKDSVYYAKAYYQDNAGAYHYSNVTSFTSLGTKAPIVSYLFTNYTWGDLAKLTIPSLKITAVGDINIIINGNVSLHPDKIEGTDVYFKVPATLTNNLNSLTVSIYGQVSNSVSLSLAQPQILSGLKNLYYNDTLSITGKYFNPEVGLNKVKIGNTLLDVISGSTTRLIVKASSLTMSDTGPLNITTGTNLGTTSNDNYNVYRYFKPLNSFPGVGRMYAVAQSMNNKLYYGLGFGEAGALKDWWEYDPATNKWTQLANYPAPAWFMKSFVLANKIFIGMGIISDGVYSGFTSGFYAYNRQSNTWTMTAQMQIYNGNEAVISNNKYAYLVGGRINSVLVPDVWRYDPAADRWQKMADFPGPLRESPMSFSIGDKGYVVGGGGTGFQPMLKDLWQFDFNSERWKQMADIPQEAGNMAGFNFALNGKGYIGGGLYNTVDGISFFVYEFDPTTNSWTKKERILDAIAYNASATSINNVAYVLGGYKYYTPSFSQGTKSFVSFVQ